MQREDIKSYKDACKCIDREFEVAESIKVVQSLYEETEG